MSYVFYDTETTGTNTFFDQVLQFAAIKTDEEFNELDRIEIRCRLLPHIIPSPTALHITGVTIEQLLDEGLPSHYEMMQIIKKKLEEWTPSVFIGWNSIKFDEELLRQSLYQNLHNPYMTNLNGNCRTDALPIVMVASQYGETDIKVPLNDKSKPTFKLDHIAPANNFQDHDAHDAVGDVEATIHMCKLVESSAPDCWSNAIKFSQKAAVISFITEESVYLFVETFYGKTHSSIVTTLGQRPDVNNQYYVYNLIVDPEEINAMNNDEILNRLSSYPKPVRKIKTNASPFLLDEDEIPDLISEKYPDLEILNERAQYLNDNPELVRRLIDITESNLTEYPESEHVEEQIYNGFMSSEDSIIAERLHASGWNICPKIVKEFSDNKLKTLAKRLIYNESPESFEQEERMEIDKAIARRQLGLGFESPEWNILPNAIREVDDLIRANADLDTEHLESIREFLIEKQQLALTIIE